MCLVLSVGEGIFTQIHTAMFKRSRAHVFLCSFWHSLIQFFVQFNSLKLTDCLKTTYLNWVPCMLTYLMTLFNIFYGKKWIHMIWLIIDVLISSFKLWCQKVHKKYSRPTFVDFLHFKTINPLFLISHRNRHLNLQIYILCYDVKFVY